MTDQNGSKFRSLENDIVFKRLSQDWGKLSSNQLLTVMEYLAVATEPKKGCVGCQVHESSSERRQLLSRLLMIVDRRVPQEAFKGLSGMDFWTFMTVLDLAQWPERMNHLKDYVEFYEELEDL